jgi:small ligand-binding sensory domain FIST
MDDLRFAHAAAEDWRQAVENCAVALGETPDFEVGRADLGFLYVTDAYAAHMGEILDVLRGATGIEHWVGTVGIGICATGREYFDVPAMAVLAGRWPEDRFRLVPGMDGGAGPFANANRAWLDAARPTFGIVHLDPRNEASAALIADLALEASAFLVGGLTSSRGDHAQVAGGLTNGGLSGVLFAADVAVATGLTQGCVPIGPARTITSGQDNVLFEIDGEPALDIFKRDIGEALADDLAQVAGVIHAALPIRGSDTGDYLVRNLLAIDSEQGWVAIGERVAVGDRIMFCRRDGGSAREDLHRMLGDMTRRLEAPPRGGVYFTCLARGPNLFGPDSEEMRAIQAALGDVPLVGFFCNGEISHDRLYAYTGVLALFL